jgi:hypothetical protein
MAESIHVVDGRTPLNARGIGALVAVAAVTCSAAGCGSSKTRSTQASPPSHSDFSSTRSFPESGIDRTSVTKLHELWRFRLGSASGDPGGLAGTPVVSHGVAFIQDRRGDVVALELGTGAERWLQPAGSGEHGANGLAVSGPRVLGTTDTSAFALSATSGRLLWERLLVTRTERRVAAAPQATAGLVFVSTVGDRPAARGTLYALPPHRVESLAGLDGQGTVGAPGGGRRRWHSSRRVSTRAMSTGAPPARARRAAPPDARTEARIRGLCSIRTHCSYSPPGAARSAGTTR